jgi:gamma-glutamyltranspeptidase/glutathione hydrolase
MSGAVTASTQEAANAGVLMLERGGNAVDAVVAAALAACVADPCNTGLGGYGGYLIVGRPREAARCVAFPVSAPSSLPAGARIRSVPAAGPACSTVPNVVAGLAAALQGFGSQSWVGVSGEAIRLAREGVVANRTTTRAFTQHRDEPFIAECFEFEEHPVESGLRLTFRQPQLAATLEQLATQGPLSFYAGPLASDGAAAMAAATGVPLSGWLDQPKAVFVDDAAHLVIEGVEIASAPLGLTGSACMYAFVEFAARLARLGTLDDPKQRAAWAMAMTRVWQYRFDTAHGNDFSTTDIGTWIQRALQHVAASKQPRLNAEHTAHLNAVDDDGMMAALTFTHGPSWFGGRWVLPGSGVLMNAGMLNLANAGTVANGQWRYGISNMSPTISQRVDGTRLALGCPGARRIPANVALVLAQYLFGDRPLQDCVHEGRFHAETPESVFVETTRCDSSFLIELGHRFGEVRPEISDNYYGPLTAIARTPGGQIEIGVDDRDFAGFCAVSHRQGGSPEDHQKENKWRG